MKKRIFKPVSYVLIIALGLAMTFTSCEKTPEVMDLPPKASLQMDLDVFPSQGATKHAVDTTAINWWTSLVKVGVWNLGIAANIIVPLKAYEEAFEHEAVYQGDDEWEWSYSVTVGVDTYVASLIGKRLNRNEFSMTMYVSKSGMNGFDNFEWFSGVIRDDHTKASWSMNHSPNDKVAYLEIEYNNDLKGNSDIRYTCVDPDNELYNGFIEYGIDTEFDYDAYYTISRTEGTAYIEWSTETSAGRVMDEAQYGNDAWHCWDSLLQDVNCPE